MSSSLKHIHEENRKLAKPSISAPEDPSLSTGQGAWTPPWGAGVQGRWFCALGLSTAQKFHNDNSDNNGRIIASPQVAQRQLGFKAHTRFVTQPPQSQTWEGGLTGLGPTPQLLGF